jgi:hypothetical protein
MLSVTVECTLFLVSCWMSILLSANVSCSLCWVTVMLCVFMLIVFMPSVYAGCKLFWISCTLSVNVRCQLCWVSFCWTSLCRASWRRIKAIKYRARVLSSAYQYLMSPRQPICGGVNFGQSNETESWLKFYGF